MNNISIYGTLVKDFEVKYTQSATPVAIGFSSIAVRDRRDKDKTYFFDIKCFGKTAEFGQKYFTKGAPILLSGSLEQETWTKDDKNFSKVVIKVETIDFTRSQNNTNGAAAPVAAEAETEELPF